MQAGRIILLATPAEFLQTNEPLARAYLETLRLDETSPSQLR